MPMSSTVRSIANNGVGYAINQPINNQQQAPVTKNNSSLPQTGNDETVSAAALGLMGLAVAAGLSVGATKKRHE